MAVEGFFWNFLVANFLAFFIALIFSALSFYLAGKAMNLKGNDFTKAVYSTIAGSLLALARDLFFPLQFIFSWLIILAVYFYAIKEIYKTDWANAFVLWLLSIVVAFVLGYFVMPFFFSF